MIPFSILKSIGYFITQIMFAGFLSGLFNFIWDLLIGIVFFIVVIFVGYTIIRNTLDNKVQEPVKKETKKSKKIVKEEIKEPTKSSTFNIIMNIVKVFVVFWSLPFVFMVGISYVLLSILIFGMTKGLMLYGFLLIVIAMILFFQQLLEVIYTLLFKNRLASLYPFILSLMLFVIGGFMSVEYLTNIKYYTNYVPEGRYEIQTTLEEINMNEKDLVFVESNNVNYRLNIDNTLEDGVILLETKYYNSYVKRPIFNKAYYDRNKDEISVSGHFELSSFIVNDYIDNLKENKIYNILELTKLDVTIHASEATMKRVTFVKR
jgi:K+-sensing histidine kinase KdpD